MAIDASQLLKRLEPPVKGGREAASGPGRWMDGPSFDRMLALISRGSGVGGRNVLLQFDPQPPLDAQQLQRLGAAAEVAQRAGAERAIMLIDGRAFVLKVDSREIVSELRGSSQHELVELDAAVYVAASKEGGGSRGIPGLQAVLPPSIAAQIGAKFGEVNETGRDAE